MRETAPQEEREDKARAARASNCPARTRTHRPQGRARPRVLVQAVRAEAEGPRRRISPSTRGRGLRHAHTRLAPVYMGIWSHCEGSSSYVEGWAFCIP